VTTFAIFTVAIVVGVVGGRVAKALERISEHAHHIARPKTHPAWRAW
jgi:hypothetical protein